MGWLHYLIEANIYLGVFYLCYYLFLNRETHYLLARIYLLFSCVIAFILPLTQVSILKSVEAPAMLAQQPTFVLPAAVVHLNTTTIASVRQITIQDMLIYIYIAGVVITLFVLVYRLRKLYILTTKNKAEYVNNYKLVKLNDDQSAFSFFNYMFIGNDLIQADTIIAHELVHIRQKHSADIIFLEIVKIINWFNPFTYFIQHSLKTIHEYIADEQTAAKEQDTIAYSSFLLNNAYGIQGTPIAHSFFNYNLLKKRIIMLNKNRSGKLARLKYLAALPLCAGMLCTSTLVFSKDYGLIDLAPRKAVKPVIDSTKYALKIADIKTNMQIISDKFSVTNPKNGVEYFYTVNSLTEKNKADLKKRGFEVSIIEREEAKSDTILPPPPPPPAPRIKAPKAGKIPPPPPPVIVPDKPSKAGKAPSPPYAVIPDAPSKPGKAPSPPYAVVPDAPSKPGKAPSPPYAVVPDAPSKPGKAPQAPPPPPPPYDAVYSKLFRHVAKFTRYPAIAREKKVTGNIILSISIGNDHKITGVKLEKGIGYGCDEELIRAVKSYDGTINKTAGVYTFVGSFNLIDGKDNQIAPPKPIGSEIAGKGNFMGQVVLAGYVN